MKRLLHQTLAYIMVMYLYNCSNEISYAYFGNAGIRNYAVIPLPMSRSEALTVYIGLVDQDNTVLFLNNHTFSDLMNEAIPLFI